MYDHFIALDWAQSNMAIARMTRISNEVKVMDVRADVKDLVIYLKSLKGKKILTLEETTTAQWLYTELRGSVDQLVVCDPYRNRLLCEGAKTDKIDAIKLVRLLKGDLIKPVFHSGDALIELRKLVSGYSDLIQRGVRLKNQRSAQLRAVGGNAESLGASALFVQQGLDDAIEEYEKERKRYEEEFRRYRKKLKVIRDLETIPGIGLIGAIKIAATVVDGRRFPNRRRFWSYCGLVRHDRISGGKSYGHKEPRYSRVLKAVFKSAALAALDGENIFGQKYRTSLSSGVPVHQARHAVARRIASAALGVMTNKLPFKETAQQERAEALKHRS